MISGKSFSSLCRWSVDNRTPEIEPFHYARASPGDWVFVNGDFLVALTTSMPFLAVKKFVFIIHNTDRPFGAEELRRLLPHANLIYAINTTVSHPRLTTIPIGFVDRQLPFLSSYRPSGERRDIEIYMNFTAGTNIQKRRECALIFEKDPRVTTRSGLTVPEYYNNLSRAKYVLCPEGTGIDTHRVYEAIFCGAIPVVVRNSLAHMYEKLPVCIVNAWTDPFYEPREKVFNTSARFYL